MAHFSNHIQFKVLGESVRLSFRISDFYVIEHIVPISDFKGALKCSSENWEGEGSVHAKIKGGSVWFRVCASETHRYVYSIATRTFSELRNEFLSRET